MTVSSSIVLMKYGMNFTVHRICMVFELISVNSVLVVKSGEHYDAIVPSNITLSTIPINDNRDITFSHNKMNNISQHSRISGNKKVLPDNTIDLQYNIVAGISTYKMFSVKGNMNNSGLKNAFQRVPIA